MQIRTKESRKRLQSLILLTAFTCVLLIVSTYAWFTVQKDVTISNIRGKVEVAEGLQVSLDAARWAQEIDLESAEASLTTVVGTDGVIYGPADTAAAARNHVPAEFKPVSASGEKTADNKNLSMVTGTYANKKITNVEQCDESVTSTTAANYAGYYAFDMYLMNSSKTGTTSDTLQLNSDAFAWVLAEGDDITEGSLTYKGNSDSGLQNTIRVAFAKYGDSTDAIPTTNEPADIRSAADAQTISDVSIWEPNAFTHTNYVLTNVRPLFDTTYADDNDILIAAENNAFTTKTIKKGVTSMDNVYDWTSGDLLTPQTVQTKVRSVDPLNPYIDGGVQDLKNTEGGNFTLEPNSITKIRVYIYMEGQDPDCHNIASHGGGIEVNIGLTKTEDPGDVDRYNQVMNIVSP